MSFTGNYLCTSFKRELFEGLHDFTSHTFKMALYDSDATLDYSTTDYSATNEVSGTGYSAGGVTLTAIAPTDNGLIAWVDFEDATIATATLTARGGLIYNTTAGGGVGTTNAVCVLDFGLDRTKAGEDFVITFPTPDALNAILKL